MITRTNHKYKLLAITIIISNCCLIFASATNAKFQCSTDGTTYYISDQNSCTKYHLCRNGELYESECINGYYFNDDRLKCEKIPDYMETCSKTNEKFIIQHSIIRDSDVENPCETIDESIFIPDPTNCAGFYFCHLNNATHFICGEGKYFSISAQGCVPQDTVDCPLNLHRCENVTGSVFIRDPNSCAGFFWCHNYEVFLHAFCNDGLNFNYYAQSCDFEENVVCLIDDEEEPEPEPDPTNPCQFIDDSLFIQHPESCYTFIWCHENRPEHIGQCAPGLYFNVETQACDFKENVECDIEGPELGDPCENTVGDIFVPDPTSCHGFVFCSNGEFSGIGSCPDGFYFEPSSQLCDFPENVLCDNGNRPSVTPTPEPTTTTITPDPSTPTLPTPEITTPTTTTTDITTTTESTPTITTTTQDPHNLCTEADEGLFILDPESCNGFYFCHLGNGLHFTCPEGHYFHLENQRCELSEFVVCHLVTTPTPTTPTTTPTTTPPTTTTTQPTTIDPAERCTPETEGFFITDPNDCAGFYFCQDGEPTHHGFCPEGFLFDEQNQLCNYPELVDCENQ